MTRKTLNTWPAALALVAAGMLAGCSQTAKSPDVTASIRQGLDQAGLKQVSVTEDRDKGVVTLGGHVPADGDKAQAQSIASSIARGEVVANEIAVLPVGAESAARSMNSDLDKGIGVNLDAALIQNRMQDGVKYSVKNHVVTLTGEVRSEARRADVQAVAAGVPNVQQVINELQVKNQRASVSQ